MCGITLATPGDASDARPGLCITTDFWRCRILSANGRAAFKEWAKSLATASCRNSNTWPWLLIFSFSQDVLWRLDSVLWPPLHVSSVSRCPHSRNQQRHGKPSTKRCGYEKTNPSITKKKPADAEHSFFKLLTVHNKKNLPTPNIVFLNCYT